VRKWASRGLITRYGSSGRAEYDIGELMEMAARRHSRPARRTVAPLPLPLAPDTTPDTSFISAASLTPQHAQKFMPLIFYTMLALVPKFLHKPLSATTCKPCTPR
jgi:hypothetical protein